MLYYIVTSKSHRKNLVSEPTLGDFKRGGRGACGYLKFFEKQILTDLGGGVKTTLYKKLLSFLYIYYTYSSCWGFQPSGGWFTSQVRMRSLVFGVTLSALDRVTTLLLEIWQRFDTSSGRCQAITGHTHCGPIR